MEVYLDVLFLENVVMNYLILLVTARFSKAKTSSLRMLLGAIAGACYVLVLLFNQDVKLYYTTLAKIALSLAMIAIVFSPEKPMSFFKILAIFYFSTFIFAGAAFAFMYFNQTGGFVRNGILYDFSQNKLTLLIYSIVMVGILVRIFWELIQYKFARENLLLTLKIAFEQKTISISALVDTGNSLHDPLTDMPVIVVEYAAIKEVLPGDIQYIFEQSKENDLAVVTEIVSNSRWMSRFRLIPFSSIGKENGMLIGFKPDYVEIGETSDKKGVSNVIICIYNKVLSKTEKYKALLSPELVA
ncbi:MAG: sigma-E processing peptidase SpoIIGA [Clostridia bacterium]|nr:sigma-E processing peptidase SpoIIGA [Clostridia bacterium]